jgi:hypothetical protein
MDESLFRECTECLDSGTSIRITLSFGSKQVGTIKKKTHFAHTLLPMVGIASAVNLGLHGADIDVNVKFLDTGEAVAINAQSAEWHGCGPFFFFAVACSLFGLCELHCAWQTRYGI